MRLPIIVTVLAALAAVADVAAGQQTDPARDVGLVERAESRLAQVDVAVIGPEDAVRSLTTEDFRIRINFKRLHEFQLDRICPAAEGEPVTPPTTDDPAAEGEPVTSPTTDDPPAPAVRPSPSYLFYFDQPQLTLGGRQRALDIARELVGRLITADARALIVSNASELKLVEPLTGDPQRLLEALERLEHDRTQWDFYAEREKRRVDDVTRLLNETEDIQRAISLARTYQKEERWRTERNLRRLNLTLGRLFDLDAPKSVIYFADTLRANAGEHYISFFGSALRNRESTLGVMQSDALTGRLPFDQVVNTASAQGIRFYTVEAQGLVSHMDRSQLNPKALSETGTVPSSSRVRLRDAQQAMQNLSGETGGEAFLHGVRASKIGDRIVEDASCIYLVSFDPGDLREDAALRISVNIVRDNVRARVRGRLVLPSESTRRSARVLRAFGTAGEVGDPFGLRVGLVPLGFRDGAYDALLQVGVPGTPLQSATWDLGASLVSAQKVRAEASGQIRIDTPGVIIVLEREMKIKPGDYQVVSVAHEAESGLVFSDESAFGWPSARSGEVAVSPIALLQPVSGAFLRDGETRTRGSLALGLETPALADRPSALVGLVCRGKRLQGELQLDRVLIGRSERQFDPLELGPEEDRCIQVRDLLPEGSLIPGYYRYEIRVTHDGETLGEGVREFYVAPPAG